MSWKLLVCACRVGEEESTNFQSISGLALSLKEVLSIETKVIACSFSSSKVIDNQPYG